MGYPIRLGFDSKQCLGVLLLLHMEVATSIEVIGMQKRSIPCNWTAANNCRV